MFPPGRSSRATMLLVTASATFTKTIGIVRVSRWTATVAAVEPARMMSGCRPTNSCAEARIRSLSARLQRRSMRTLRPSLQPKSASACVNAERRRFPSGSFSSNRHEHANAARAVALLCPCRERPRRRAAKERDEPAAQNHSITSVARA